MDLDEKQRFISTIEYIVSELISCPHDSIVDIVNEALEQWPLIDGFLDEETLTINAKSTKET